MCKVKSLLMLQEAEDSFYLIRKQVKDWMYARDREVIVMDTGGDTKDTRV